MKAFVTGSCGFLGSHLVDRLVDFPRETLADPFSLLRFWESLSSFERQVQGLGRSARHPFRLRRQMSFEGKRSGAGVTGREN